MPANIIATSEFATSLTSKYYGLKVPTYKLRKWFARDRQVLFDCESPEKKLCLETVLGTPDFPAFRVYLVIKDAAREAHSFMDVNFRNLAGKETLRHFIDRYHKQLETMTKLSLQGAGREYIDCVGHSYEDKMP